MAESFARPALELPKPLIGGLEVAAAASAGQGLALDETGRVPRSATGIITGVVASDGGITAGSAFTVSKGATGIYTITFTTLFGTAPLVVGASSVGGVIFSTGVPTVSSVAVNLRDAGDVVGGVAQLRDAAFNFFAMPVA